MKGKITIVLFSLALVFGMIAASCDNGDFPDGDNKDASTLIVYEKDASKELPKISAITDQPIRLSAADIRKNLDAKVEFPAGSKTFVPQYAIATVAYNQAKHGAADTADGRLATKYAGLKIFVVIER